MIFSPKTIPLDYGGLRIVAHSRIEKQIRAHSARKEPETVKWLERLPKDTVLWDIGANIGAYSLIAAKLGLQVYAFEPHPHTFTSLCENIDLNGFQRWITPIPLALYHTSGLRFMAWSSPDSGTALHHLNDGASRILTTSPDMLIQAYGIPSPTAVKLDCDGSEFQILFGLRKYASVKHVMVEVDDRQVPDLLKKHGFKEKGSWAIPNFTCYNAEYERC